jgi:transposase
MRRKVNETTFEGKSFYIGIDAHLKAMKVTILGESQEHKTFSSNADAEKLAAYLKRNFPGAKFYAVYEAGFSGFTL